MTARLVIAAVAILLILAGCGPANAPGGGDTFDPKPAATSGNR